MNPLDSIRIKGNEGFILFIALFISISAGAQRLTPIGKHIKRGPKTNFGIEALMGTREFHIQSDIEAIHKMNVHAVGGSVGMTVGSRFYTVKLRQGFFSAEPTDANAFDQTETSGIFNLHLLKIFNSRIKYFEPYLIASANRSAVRFSGNYLPANNSLPEENDKVVYLGKVVNIFGNVGLGFEGRIPGYRHFANFFAEVQYGVPFSASTKNTFFKNTNTSNLLSVNFGIGFGISR